MTPEVGTVGWMDLTVPDADAVRDFYQSVVGWKVEACDMGGYSDYTMTTESGKGVAGVCWARGVNARLPPVWLMYITIANMDESIASVIKLGGKVIAGPKNMGKARYAVIEDPAGAKCALYQP
jgi:predicted enzyme related to lactoylglutathione lyase